MLVMSARILEETDVSIVRTIARPLLSAAYVTNGIARVRDPQSAARSLEPLLAQVNKKVDVPVSAETLARATGAAQAAAGTLLAIGRLPRVSSAILVSTFLLDTLSDQFWKEKDAVKRKEGASKTITKLSILGGALLASVDTAGKPGLAWRAQHAAGAGIAALERTGRQARREVQRARKDAARVTKDAASAVGL